MENQTLKKERLSVQVADVSGQKLFQLDGIETDDTVGELLDKAVLQMSMPANDVAGRPLVYNARLDREGRQLHTAERVGDAVVEDNRLTILPTIDAASA